LIDTHVAALGQAQAELPALAEPATWWLTSAVLLVAYVIRGITGFGSGLISVPLLALFLPLTFVVPLVLLLDFTASLVVGGLNFKKVLWREVGVLIPLSVVGVIVGTHLLVNLPQTPMLIALAVFILAFALRSLFNLQGKTLISRWWALPASFTGGAVGGLFGTGGPPYVIYMNHRVRDNADLRATLSALFFFEGLVRIVSFVAVGLLVSVSVWLAFAAALPLMLGALALGGRLHVGFSRDAMTRLVGVLLLVASVSLWVKAAGA
jgi:uncharacterized membrane protein YfcA